MARHRLYVKEIVAKSSVIEIETDLLEEEIDALLSEIEQENIKSALNLTERLALEGVRIKAFNVSNIPYHMKAEVLEIEEI